MWLLKKYLNDLDLEYSEPPRGIKYDISIKLFKELKKGKKAEELVNEIISRIKDYVLEYKFINGYLNLKLDFRKILDEIENLFIFEKKDKVIYIEHTSANPNKQLHIGHLRNFILGDSIYRLYESLNYKTYVINYIDDTGAQVSDVVLAIYLLKFPEDPKEFEINKVKENIINFLKKESIYKEEYDKKILEIIKERTDAIRKLYGYDVPKKYDHYIGDFIYVIVNKLYDLIPDLKRYKSFINDKIEKGDNEIYDLAKRIVDNVLESQLETLWKFNVYYDLFVRESDIIKYNIFDKAFEILKEKNLIKYETEGEKKGCWVIDLDRWDEFKNYEDKKKVLIRSDGTSVYLAKDIAYAFWKLGIIKDSIKFKEYKLQPNSKYIYEININGNFIPEVCDISINVIGFEQTYLQLIIKKIIEELNVNKKYIHYSYGLVMLSKNTAKIFGIDEDIVRMSGRKGININVDDLYEKLYQKVYNLMKERLKDLDEKKLEELSHKVTISIISYEILKYSRNSLIVFDFDKILNFEEGNGIYLLYTYARINSLLKKAPKIEKMYFTELNDLEKKLIVKILQFKDVLYDVEKSLDINDLVKYTIDLVKSFNEFYQSVPIISELDKYPHRLLLVLLTKKVLEKIFYILKIEPVEVI